jgi:hypothetical protein
MRSVTQAFESTGLKRDGSRRILSKTNGEYQGTIAQVISTIFVLVIRKAFSRGCGQVPKNRENGCV